MAQAWGNRHTFVNEFQQAAETFIAFLAMLEAHYEAAELGELADTEVVSSFMGSGAGHRIFVGDLRKLREALRWVEVTGIFDAASAAKKVCCS